MHVDRFWCQVYAAPYVPQVRQEDFKEVLYNVPVCVVFQHYPSLHKISVAHLILCPTFVFVHIRFF